MYTKAEIEQALADTDGFNIKIPSNIKALAVLKEVAECYLCETFPFDWAKDAQPGMCGADNAGEKYWYIGRDPLQPSYLVFRVQELDNPTLHKNPHYGYTRIFESKVFFNRRHDSDQLFTNKISYATNTESC